MKTAIALAVTLALVGSSPRTLHAQGFPGTNLSTLVRVRAVSIANDTTTVSYSLLNSSGSVEHLFSFHLFTPVPLSFMTRPTGDWTTGNDFDGQTIAYWGALGTIAPGDSTPTLTIHGVGLPAIVAAWYGGDHMPTVDDGADSTDVFNTLVSVPTVGIEAAPTSLNTLVPRLKTLTDSSCTLSWITDGGLCTALSSALAASPSQVLGYTTTLDSARSGGSAVTDAAYLMLKANAEYIKAFIDIPAISLTYVCGGKFNARNVSYPAIVMSETDQYGTHSRTLPARTTDGPGYTDLTIYGSTMVHPTYPLTVTLSYGGTVVKTATGNGPDC